MGIRISNEFLKYCIVGLINTLVGISTAFICLNICLWTYATSTGLAYLTGVVASFYLNKKFTFKNKDATAIQFFKFFTTMLPAYVVSYWLGFEIAHFSFRFGNNILEFLTIFTAIPHDRLVDNLAIILSMTIYLLVGFSINKFVVFRKKHKDCELEEAVEKIEESLTE